MCDASLGKDILIVKIPSLSGLVPFERMPVQGNGLVGQDNLDTNRAPATG